MMKKSFLIIFYLFAYTSYFSQNKLRLTYERLGKVKTYEFYTGDLLDYRLKGSTFYNQDKISNLQDSMIVFRNDTIIRLNEIRTVRIMSSSHLAKTLQDAFVISGAGFILLNTVNNAIYSRTPLVDPASVYISAGLLTGGLIIKAMRTKIIHITKNKTLKIIEGKYENLNSKKEF
jgi:hypothetical protein